MDVVEVVRRVGATTKKTEKEAILTEAFFAGQHDFFIGAKLAYDVLITFGVAKAAELLEDDGAPGTFTFTDFLALAEKLRMKKGKRELTGHAARDAIRAAADACDVPTWNLFYRKVILKDLGIGITEGTINRVLEKIIKEHKGTPYALQAEALRVPTFECQLAKNGDKEHPKYLNGKKLLDIKLDGVRLLAGIDKEERTITHYMRDGKVNENFPGIRDAMLPLLDILPASVMLDGEVVMSTFQELMSNLNKEGADTSSAKLALFDVVPLGDFFAGFCATKQHARHAVLTEMETSGLFSQVTKGSLYVVPKVEVDMDTPEGQAVFKEFNNRALAAGFEGIMIKDPEAPYECKRSFGWLKKKPKISVTLKVVGFEVGDPEGKFKNSLGALICEGFDEGVDIATKCGGGFTDEQRNEIMNNPEQWLGMMVEIEGDKLTLEEGSKVHSVRFPVFKGPRGTKPGEKL